MIHRMTRCRLNRTNPQAQRNTVGTNLSLYKEWTTDNLEDIFVCKICRLPSRDPQLSVCCGHTFCKCCFDEMKRTSINAEVCPVCREDKNFRVVPKAIPSGIPVSGPS